MRKRGLPCAATVAVLVFSAVCYSFHFSQAFHSCPLGVTSQSESQSRFLPAGMTGASCSIINSYHNTCSYRRRPGVDIQLGLNGVEALAVGAVVGGAAVVAASRGISTLAGAFTLADYRTTSGHDLRLDEKLKSKRRQLLAPPSEVSPGGSRRGDKHELDLGEGMDWREEIRLASQLPDDSDACGTSRP